MIGRGSPAHAPSVPSFDEPDTSVEALHWELSQLKDSIDHMKMEIAALRGDKAPTAPWDKAACELDAVVRATETATHTILEAAEQIDSVLVALRRPEAVPDEEAVDRIGEHVVRIFEACNFQDITGQRITKVVGAIKFIEGRIDRMIEILGGQSALGDVELPPDEAVDADAALLAGPQLETDPKISQDDIDRFFD
jgi:chemotaxis protein CheZ